MARAAATPKRRRRRKAAVDWDEVEFQTASPADAADLLDLKAKADGGDPAREGVQAKRFRPSYMTATNGGASVEPVLAPLAERRLPPERRRAAIEANANGDQPADAALQNVIGGSDERVLIEDTSLIPARSIGLLEIVPEHGPLRYGAAWLIGPRTLATAAHNLVHPEAGVARSMRVGLAYDGRAARGGWHKIVDNKLPAAWRQAPKPGSPYDFAVLKIADASVGDALGWFGFADYSDAKFDRLVVNIFGYPLDLKDFHMYGAAGRILDLDAGRLFYNCDAGGGMSGGPVIARFGEMRIAVGVHAAGGVVSNVGTRINDAAYKLFAEFQAWQD